MKLRINLSKPLVLVTTIFSIGVNLVSPVMANELRVIELYKDSQAIVDLSKGQQLRIKILIDEESYAINKKNLIISLGDAALQGDGSIVINGERIYSLR